jgi:hypothetical protein
VIVVFILNWNLFEELKAYLNALQLRNKQDENFEVHFIELEKFNKSVEELGNRMGYWATF